MISIRLLVAALVYAGAALLIIELIIHLAERKLNLLAKLPPDLLEDITAGFFVSKFIMQLAFLVVIPTIAYSWFYLVIPLYGTRAGVGMAVFIFLLGIVPYSSSLFMRVKLPMAYTLFHMAGYFVKIVVVYGIIAYLYIL